MLLAGGHGFGCDGIATDGTSGLKSQTSNRKPQTSNLKPHMFFCCGETAAYGKRKQEGPSYSKKVKISNGQA